MKLANFLGPDGSLKMHLKGYEDRKEQLNMAQDVLDAFKTNSIALIEAGTGIGKSLAYLIPALLWTQDEHEPIVISTNTIALQEQLIEKDIPLALKVLGLSLKPILVKGMGNYLCLRKLQDAVNEGSLLQLQEHDVVAKIDKWSQNTAIGSKADLPFFPSAATWEQVSADADACSHVQCPFFNNCFFFKARKEAQDAKIIIVNHHMLFADLRLRIETNNFTTPALLPCYGRLIIDEAHHIEDVATEYFADRISRFELLKVFSQLGGEKTDKNMGKIHLLKQKLLKSKESTQEIVKIIQKLDVDVAGARRETHNFTQHLFDNFSSFCSLFPTLRDDDEQSSALQGQKLRIKEPHVKHSFWTQELVPKTEQLIGSIMRLTACIQSFEIDIQLLKQEKIQEETKSIRVDIKALQAKLEAITTKLKRFISPDEINQTQANKVRWIEQHFIQGHPEVQLVAADQDLSSHLKTNLFDKLTSTILCSATLSSHQSFSYMRSRIGLKENPVEKQGSFPVIERIYTSPFDFANQAFFGIPSDLPLPDDSGFLYSSKKAILSLIEASQGNAFVLFTSYSMLKNCYKDLSDELEKRGFHLMKQGDDHRQTLIKRFKEKPRSVLFGTDSFWEGIDIAGDALRSVIITKLPFHVPSEPISEVRSEVIAKRGGNPFVEYAIPRAVVKFKQGFGRLIRRKDDRGCVICLDGRLLKKSYGRVFLKSLPKCKEVFEPLDVLCTEMKSFYKEKIQKKAQFR